MFFCQLLPLWLVSIFCMLSCGGDRIEKNRKWFTSDSEDYEEDGPQSTNPIVLTPDLNPQSGLLGRWHKPCSKIGDDNPREVKHQNLSVVFSTSEATFTSDIFKRSNCRALSVSYLATFQYSSSTNPLKKIDYTVREISLVPRTEADVQRFIQSQFCGILDWSLNVASKIAGIRCFDNEAPFPKVGSKIYDVFEIDNGQLFFGLGAFANGKPTNLDLDGSSPEKRPIQVQREDAFHKTTGE